ncbi:TIGR04283 family arsenosugar biosynthesis glycosyltransferase [Winogradskyella sp. UBA3174]|uniref:TIGR04283 family arsenosugar biosynthesis glycosyltransferase n=1 Tax=Winogradskyella sp. UBA3174 TaxID=1947785 RepID=UPI0025E97D08|nr:TIGR04283 family arsenosugar biosynthesis glycosyltransferase [Winogradskyella sp. UBA3174]|tara:strand:+ start:15959 stop:16657 length:699 start_codon:yes stop_codon:yes gene_type:complete
MKHKISIIIPVLNESVTIKDLLFHLIDNASLDSISEIIVVDGGSTDGTENIVKTLDLNIILLNSEKGRAKQMNLGATKAKGSVLYFLHADSFPPNRYDKLIIKEVEKGNKAGCFRMQFDSNHWWLKLASWLTQFSWRACRGGDQSQFITQELFDTIGGYDEDYIIYEDNILINELYVRNEFVVIQDKIKTSARLYKKHGVWKLQYYFWMIYVKRWFGASADELFTYYKKQID